jgi:hypothetical protein
MATSRSEAAVKDADQREAPRQRRVSVLDGRVSEEHALQGRRRNGYVVASGARCQSCRRLCTDRRGRVASVTGTDSVAGARRDLGVDKRSIVLRPKPPLRRGWLVQSAPLCRISKIQRAPLPRAVATLSESSRTLWFHYRGRLPFGALVVFPAMRLTGSENFGLAQSPGCSRTLGSAFAPAIFAALAPVRFARELSAELIEQLLRATGDGRAHAKDSRWQPAHPWGGAPPLSSSSLH